LPVKVTFYGVRGSVPSPGPATVRYGGNTSCVEVVLADGTQIILDAGTGVRALGKQMVGPDEHGPLPSLIHVLLTHGHWDHIIGLPFFDPMFRSDARIVFHTGSRHRYDVIGRRALFDGDHFPVRGEDIPAHIDRNLVEGGLRIGSARISHVMLNHPGGCDGFRIDDDDGASVCYLTDNELAPPGAVATPPEALARFAAGASLVIHDAQYLPSDMPEKRGWGHSVVDQVLELGRAAEARVLALHHHDPDRDDHALDRIGAAAAAWATAHAPEMECVVAAEGISMELRPR
jgi:phosphoribosyl 1,2-cyclic phosphodiesterase